MNTLGGEKLYPKRQLTRAFLIGLLIGAIVMLAITQIVAAVQKDKAPAPSQAQAQPSAAAEPDKPQGIGIDMARRDPDDMATLGKPDAPLVIVEFADYRCPFCSLYMVKTLPKIVNEYVNTGLVRYEFRDMPVFGEQSFEAAVAGRAAGLQGRYWEFQHAIAENGVKESGHPDLPTDRLVEFAKKAGVPDLAKFKQDLSSKELHDAVGRDFAESRKLGISSVPAFLIGDTPMLGAQEFETFEKVINDELAERGIKR